MKKIANFAALALLALHALLGPARADVASVSCVAGGVSDTVQLADDIWPPGVSLLAKANNLSGTYSVEVSNDQPVRPSFKMNYVLRAAEAASIAHWLVHDELSEQGGDGLSNVVFPIIFVRLNCISVTSGTVTLGVATKGHND